MTDSDAKIQQLQARIAELENSVNALQQGYIEVFDPRYDLLSGHADVLVGPYGVRSLSGVEKPYLAFFNAMSEAGVTIEKNGRILYCNPCLTQLLKTSKAALQGKNLLDWINPDDRAQVRTSIQQAQRHTFKTNLLLPDQTVLPVLIGASPMTFDDCELVCLVISDLSVWIQAEQLQIQSQDLKDQLVQKSSIEKNIQIERDFIESIIDSLSTEICVIDSQGMILYVNQAWCHFYQANDIQAPSNHKRPFVGHNYLQFYQSIASLDTPTSRQIQDIYCGIMAVMDGTLPRFKTEYRCDSPQEQRWFILVIVPFNDGSGRIVINHENITELKKAELFAKQYEAIVNSSEDAIIAMDLKHCITHWNPGASRLFGYSEAEMIGHSIERLYPRSLPEDETAIARVQQGISVDHFESIRKNKKGEVFPVSVTLSPIKTSDGDCIGISKIVRDITRLRQQQEYLQQTEQDLLHTRQMLRSLIDAIPAALAHWDKKQRCVVANLAYAHFLGKSSSKDLIGRLYLELVGSETFVQDLPLIERVLTGESIRTERLIQNPQTQESQSVMMRFLPHYQGQKVEGFYIQIEDITPIAQAREAAQMANLAKSSFLSTMSHEIRTPLNAIIGTTYLLQSTPLSAEQLTDIKTIEISSKNLLSLINDVLDISKIEAGELEIDFHNFSIRELVQDLHTLFAPMAREKSLNLQVNPLDEQIPDILHSDSHRVKQILINLLNNAIKFTLTGFIRLDVQALRSDTASGQIWLRLSVEDSGIGIQPEIQNQLFRPFVQADTSTARRFGGTGLGLSIIKQLALMLDGEVGFKSQINQGSIFWVDLPFLIANRNSSHNSIGSKVNKLQLALLTESQSEQPLISLCQEFNWEVNVYDSTEPLQEQLQALSEQNNLLFCVLLDSQHDQATALQTQLREQKQPAVMLSAACNNEQLFNAISQALIECGYTPTDVIQAAVTDFKHHQWLNGVHILAVDDSVMNLEVIRRILVNEGAQVTVCTGGQQAINLLRNSTESFDSILMDLQMPGMDGYDTTLSIRNVLGLIDIPIIALTGGATTTEQQKALAAGMDDFLTKPVEPARLICFLKQHIELNRGTPLPIIRRSEPVGEKKSKDWPVIEGIDGNDVFARMGGDKHLFKKSLTQFIHEFGELNLPETVLTDPDLRLESAKRFHKMAGNSGLLGARQIQRLSQLIEQQLKNEADPSDDFRQLATQLQVLIASAQCFIDETDALPQPASGETILDSAKLEQLRKQLRANKISSLKIYQDIASGLRQQLSEEDYRQLDESINHLDFPSALARLESLNLENSEEN